MTEGAIHGRNKKAPVKHTSADPKDRTNRNWYEFRYESAVIDLHGRYEESMAGAKYFLNIVANTTFRMRFPLANQSCTAVLEKLDTCFIQMGRPYKIKADRGSQFFKDNPEEFSRFEKAMLAHNIAVETAANEAAWEVGAAERDGRTAYENVTSALIEACLPQKYWSPLVVADAKIENLMDDTNRLACRGFDLICAPVTGAGLCVGEAALRYLELRATLNVRSKLLFVREGNKPWTTQFFWHSYAMPGLRALSATGDRSVKNLPWDEPRQWYIRIYRRGANEFYVKLDFNKDLRDMVFGWKPKSEPKPGHTSHVYYDIHCEDMLRMTSARPSDTRFGFLASE